MLRLAEAFSILVVYLRSAAHQITGFPSSYISNNIPDYTVLYEDSNLHPLKDSLRQVSVSLHFILHPQRAVPPSLVALHRHWNFVAVCPFLAPYWASVQCLAP
jgi:hypothetical protein